MAQRSNLQGMIVKMMVTQILRKTILMKIVVGKSAQFKQLCQSYLRPYNYKIFKLSSFFLFVIATIKFRIYTQRQIQNNTKTNTNHYPNIGRDISTNTKIQIQLTPSHPTRVSSIPDNMKGILL